MPGSRVLHVDTERTWRGGQNQVYLLHRGLVQAGADSTVLCRRGSPLARRLADEALPLATVRSGPFFALRAARAVRRCAAGGIVHAHASTAHGIARVAAIGNADPLVVTRRVDFALAGGPVARWKYGPRVARFVAVSQAVGRVLEAGGVGAERITVIPDGIDPRPTAPDREGLPADRLLVLCAAALVDHKGHRHLLDAWEEIEDAGIPATLLLAGTGEREADLRRRAQAAGLAHVRFLGWRDDMPTLWASVDAAVLASVEEGLGSSLIDSQHAGVPVVATTAGGIPEVVADGVGGLLVPPADPSALAGALRRLLTDPALRARLSAGARAHAQGFLVHRMVDRHLALYAGLAQPGTTSRPRP